MQPFSKIINIDRQRPRDTLTFMLAQTRSIASMTISFGLVAIPVKLYSATVSTERISFNLLRKTDGSRVKQQYIAVADGKALEEANSAAIDIVQFVPLKSVDPVYFDGTYYLAPDKGGAKPYTLLATASHKAGHLKTTRFDPNEFVDEYKQRVEAAIQQKVEGHEAVVATAPTSSAATGNVIDLMAALRASLQKNASPERNERKAAKRAGTVTPISHKPSKKRRD